MLPVSALTLLTGGYQALPDRSKCFDEKRPAALDYRHAKGAADGRKVSRDLYAHLPVISSLEKQKSLELCAVSKILEFQRDIAAGLDY